MRNELSVQQLSVEHAKSVLKRIKESGRCTTPDVGTLTGGGSFRLAPPPTQQPPISNELPEDGKCLICKDQLTKKARNIYPHGWMCGSCAYCFFSYKRKGKWLRSVHS